MRAEEGDESVTDYAREGKQTHDRITEARRARGPLRRITQRVAKFFRGEQDSPSAND
ncbi:hypothetical protein BN1232_05238 [Mycobacterium lentiflavum]|uniref:Uncharacterized protein n=1 Tax=Mycobacterium lentiflavum TaxID=141349 RepID=A0A0E4H100_MYCLN|nr:hypothetical protein [Mycobacterium lentiflavum]ULP41965.1 hypothetical protein MJO58_24645 [Mycobacterium lentiflavum]CQD21356.1 hypothetical protein BN1232_05238 [Mycobacterium lentiflavum]